VNLWESLVEERYGRGYLRCAVDGQLEASPWSDVVADAHTMATALRRLGVAPGTRVATVLTNSPAAVRGLLAVWLAGGVVASLPVPARGMQLDEYAEQLAALCRSGDAIAFVTDERLREALPPPLVQALGARSWESLRGPGSIDPSPPGDDEIAFVQYSSGSTSAPKGCMLTPAAIAAQLELLADMSGAVPGEETVCSWLPLSHDMGVFGCLLFAWAWDFDLALSSPERFMQAPRSWFRDAADHGATLTAATNSAVHYATRAQRSARFSGELRLRVCVIGAERIEWETLAAATEVFGPFGMPANVFMPAYGLAEATLAVTATAVEQAPHAIAVDTTALAQEEIAPVALEDDTATKIVSLGRPCRDVNVRLGDPRRLAEVYVRSPCLASGYLRDPERTRACFCDGELATGDLGFMADGELFLVGRSDDVLSVSGRNVYARELEAAIGALPPVRTGCCTIVDVPGDRVARLVALIELKEPVDALGEIAAKAAGLARAKAGVNVDECVFLEKGALPKTPTGKIQRFRSRRLVERGSLEPLGRVVLGPGGAATQRADARKTADA
jgi:fatty-acyl-CoA synthase